MHIYSGNAFSLDLEMHACLLLPPISQDDLKLEAIQYVIVLVDKMELKCFNSFIEM